MSTMSKPFALLTTIFAAVLALLADAPAARAQGDSTVYEVRTYTVNEGRLADMHETFRRYWTRTIFPKHGIEGVLYLSPTDTPLVRNTMIYVLAHPSRTAAERSWAAFGADPEVQTISRERNANGRIVAKVERVYATATDYSPVPVVAQGAPELMVLGCDAAQAQGVEEVAAVCRVNARWDEANLKMDPEIVEPILDEQFFWPTEERLVPKGDVVGILRTTDVRFGTYESEDVTVYLSGDMAHAVGISRRKVRLPEVGPEQLVRFTRTFVKRGDRWRILSHHYTPIEGWHR
jgi:hypothetical protein